MSKNKTIIPESLNSNRVQFESLAFNGTQVPIGTTNFRPDYNINVSLLTCSNKYGYFVAGTTDGFLFGETTRLRQHLRESKSEPTLRELDCIVHKYLPFPVILFHLSADELRIIVCMDQGNVMIFDVKDLVDKKNKATHSGSFKMDNEIMEFKPCPIISIDTTTTTTNTFNNKSSQNMMIMSDITNENDKNDSNSKGHPRLAIVLVKSNNTKNNDKEKMGYGCFVIDWHTGFLKAKISYNTATAIAWSTKGDEFVCGFTDGSIKCYSAFGVQKYEIPVPLSRCHQQEHEDDVDKEKEEEEKGRLSLHYVHEVLWIDQNTFFVIYTNEKGNDARIIKRTSKELEQSIKYILLDDVAPLEKDHTSLLDYLKKNAFLDQRFYTHVIHNFGPNIKYAIIIASTTSPHIMVVGHYQKQHDINDEEEECWATWTSPSYERHLKRSNNNNNDDDGDGSTETWPDISSIGHLKQTQRKKPTFTFKYKNGTFTATKPPTTTVTAAGAPTEPIYPVGVTVDYTATPTLFGKSFDSTTPILYYLTNEGMINGYIINRNDKPSFSMYDGMIRILSSLEKIPPPVKIASLMEQQQHKLQPSNTNQQNTESLKSEHPITDAVKYYEQEKISLWKQPRHIPTFRSLGTAPGASILNSPYIIKKPTFGETSMPSFRFGTTPRFGDRGPTRLGVPISDDTIMTQNNDNNNMMDKENGFFNSNNDHNDVKPDLIDNSKIRERNSFQVFFQEGCSSMDSIKTDDGSSSSSRFSFISGQNISPTNNNNNNNNNQKEQEYNFLINSENTCKRTSICDSNNTKREKMDEEKSIMNKKNSNTILEPQQKPIKIESSFTVENNTDDNNTEKGISFLKSEKIKNEQSNDNNNSSENEQRMKNTNNNKDSISSSLDIQQHNDPIKLNINNDDFRDRALALLKEAGKTYYSLLKEIEARLPLEEQQQHSSSSSSSSVKGSEKDEYPVKMNSSSQQQQQEEQQEEHFINIKDIPGWLLTLRDSINNLKQDVLEKEQELRQLRHNSSQMEEIYTKAMNETKVKTVLVQGKEIDTEKSQSLYKQVANHLNREVFLDKVINNTIELQRRQQDDK